MSDALERLRNRNRPVVPIRDASLTSSSVDTSISRNPDVQISEVQESPISRSVESKTSRNVDTSVSEDPENISPDTSTQSAQASPPESHALPDQEPLRTKQSTMRLEYDLCDRLQNLCREHNISREVLIEAMFEHCEHNSKAMKKVLSEAQKKNEQRQQLANLRRAQSMMKRFG